MKEKQNDGLALVVGGLFILALVFATYNYFNKGKDSQDTLEKRIEQMQKDQEDKVADATNEEDADVDVDVDITNIELDNTQEEGDLNGEGTATVREQTTTIESTWKANNYNQGDITGDTYTVKEGDTLWEIAEGLTGNGADWVQVLNANTDEIGYLANGQQALIVPGQVLNVRL